jgi:hypothetical protein
MPVDNIQESYRTYQPYIILGGDYQWGSNTFVTGRSFTGSIKQFKLYSKYFGPDYMFLTRLRTHLNYSAENPHLIANWRFNNTDLDTTLYDTSIYGLSTTIGQAPDFPRMRYYLLAHSKTQIEFCINKDLYYCRSVGRFIHSPYVPHGVWLENFHPNSGSDPTKIFFDPVHPFANNPNPPDPPQRTLDWSEGDILSLNLYTCEPHNIFSIKEYRSGALTYRSPPGIRYTDLPSGKISFNFIIS